MEEGDGRGYITLRGDKTTNCSARNLASRYIRASTTETAALQRVTLQQNFIELLRVLKIL